MTRLAPEWVRTSDPVIRSPARYRWTTAPAPSDVLWNDQCLIYVNTSYDRVMKILSNGATHGLFWYIDHHTRAVYKCTISRYVKSHKYGPYRGIYTNIAKTAIASLYFQCCYPISYSGHPRVIGSLICGGGGCIGICF